MLGHAASATEEQAQELIFWEEPLSVEHSVTQEERMLVGPSSPQHHLGEKQVNRCRLGSRGYDMAYAGTSLSEAPVVSDSKRTA